MVARNRLYKLVVLEENYKSPTSLTLGTPFFKGGTSKIVLRIHGITINLIYMIKPHGQLVLVSFIHYCTSTPNLSTS